MNTRDARWMIGVLAVTLSVMIWASPSVGAYINWTGENFIYPATNAAASGCSTVGNNEKYCYADLAATDTTGFLVRAIVPQDMPYSPNAPRLKCNIIARPASTGSGQTQVTIALSVATAGTSATDSTQNTSPDILTTFSGTDLAVSANSTFTTLADANAGASCGTNATCIGWPLSVAILRWADDVDDVLAVPLRVSGVICEY